jgi:hypothetical protein
MMGMSIYRESLLHASARVFSGIADITAEKIKSGRSAGLLLGLKIRKLQMASSELVRCQRTGGPKLEDELKGKLYLALRNSCAD